ncbi:MAG: DUF3772 domain-containing protein [Dokdonella sp.]
MIQSRCWFPLLVLAFSLSCPVQAQGENSLESLRARIDAIPAQSGEDADDRQLTKSIVAAYDVLGQTDAFVAKQAPALANLDARLAELGPEPVDGAAAQDPEVTARRNDLQQSRNALDADLRRAKLLGVDSQQAIAQLVELRRARFTAQLSKRNHSPFGVAFWTSIDRAYPSDSERLRALYVELRSSLAVAFNADNRPSSLIGPGLATLVIIIGSILLRRKMLQAWCNRIPPGRLRRSALAAASVLLTTAVVSLAGYLAFTGLAANAALPARIENLALALGRTLTFAAFVTALGRSLLAPRQGNWRLTDIDDHAATRIEHLPLLLAVAITFTWMLQQINAAVGASLSATVMSQTFTALVLSGLLGWGVLRLRQLSNTDNKASGARTADDFPTVTATRPAWLGICLALVAIGTLTIWIAIATGYIALGAFLARQMVWAVIVGASLYLAIHFLDDLIAALVSSRGHLGSRFQSRLSVEPRWLDQTAILLSGLVRVALLVAALAILLVPFGSSPADLAQSAWRIGSSWRIGEIAIAPGAIGNALLVLVIGLGAISIVKRWLNERFLPQTRFEPGMRNSVTTLLGYVGGVIVVAMAMSALGIGLERIAWVASALSVGIGFGLQAIVQNFISGLILLAERPVRVGDWVVLGDTEGDVRRINVRATEIQLGDRSTLIVPNSEFITKTVRNVTLANAEGRVLVRLPMPLDCEAERVRQLLLDTFDAHEKVLDVPKPSVTLEGIQDGTLIFLGTAYVPSPRQASSVRSDVLFDVLARLRASGIRVTLDTPSTTAAGHGSKHPTIPPMGGA